MLVSFDQGKTFREVGRMPGPMAASCTHVEVNDVPAGVRNALVRYQTTRQRNTLCLFDFRIDADYAEPHGGFRPVQVTYLWDENGVAKQRVHVARQPNETYVITCERPPLMRSLMVELAQ